ncbi:brain-specific angiogenesis inhibitor 1-associated protein 2-like, partial [Pollicipes pollicipes]|uniref:brain-specific angiogenesis inhibitor 1-associated protein 2-like n=1 Tax=Pollicipes pollicipes TaxID=41117 RepID=UPI0018855389
MTSPAVDTEEVARLVDSIYKNILDKFNPGARQLIAAGKAYLKALHGASAASKAYLEALSRLSGHAEESAGHGATDIGETLNDMVQTYSEIRNHELTLLKAFYVDLMAPLESNLEKDWRVVQSEHKRFTSHWRTLQDSYGRAQVGVKKSQKKLKNSKSSTMLDKEIKQIQRFDEEKIKCELFLENSLKDAMTQERRRYGFVLERQCSLAKHFHALHRTGEACLGPKLERWHQVAQTRETLAADVEGCFSV